MFLLFGYPFGTLNLSSLLRRYIEYYYRFKDSIVVSYTNHNSHITDSIQNAVQVTID